MSRRVDRKQLIRDHHRVHVVLLRQEIKRKDVIFRRLKTVAEPSQRDFNKADQVVAIWADLVPHFNDKSELLEPVDDIRRHQYRELRTVIEVWFGNSPADTTEELFKCREGLVCNKEVTFWPSQRFCVVILFWCLVFFCNALLGVELFFLVDRARSLDHFAISVDENAAAADSFNVQVKLGEGWLFLEEHHCTLSLFKHLQLFLATLHFALLLEFKLVVAFELLLGVTTLEINLNKNVSGMLLNFLLHLLFICLWVFFCTFFGAFFSLWSYILRLLRLLFLHEHCLHERNTANQLKVVGHKQLAHRHLPMDILIIDHHLQERAR